MNIYFLSSRYPPDFIGGGEWSTKYIAEALASLGESVTVLTGSKYEKTEIVNGVRVIRDSKLWGLWDKPLFEERKSRIISNKLKDIMPQDADIIHAHDFRSALVLSKLDQKNKFVTVRDYAPICGTTNNMLYDGSSCNGCYWDNVLFKCHRVKEASIVRKPFRVWQYKYNLRFRTNVYEHIENHIYISQVLKDRVSTRLKIPRTSVVIPNPVGDDWMSPIKESGSDPLIVYAGTVQSYKGLFFLIDAFEKTVRKFPEVKLELIGNGELETFKSYCAKKDLTEKVIFSGKRDHDYARQKFDEAWIIVQPSLWEEPFGRTAIEGMARGRAVVVSNIGGLKNIVNKSCGELVSPGNSDELSEKLLEVLLDNEKRQAMGKMGRKKVEENYSSKIIGEKYLDFYRSRINQ